MIVIASQIARRQRLVDEVSRTLACNTERLCSLRHIYQQQLNFVTQGRANLRDEQARLDNLETLFRQQFPDVIGSRYPVPVDTDEYPGIVGLELVAVGRADMIQAAWRGVIDLYALDADGVWSFGLSDPAWQSPMCYANADDAVRVANRELAALVE